MLLGIRLFAIFIVSAYHAQGMQDPKQRNVYAQSHPRVEPRNLLGIQSAKHKGYFAINSHPAAAFARAPAALHIIIPTTGRKSIFRMLESLRLQLKPQDSVTVGFDGQDQDGIFEDVQLVLEVFPGQNEAVMEAQYADTGASIREKHKARKGDFVLFADDDNWYVQDALDTVRAVVHSDRDALYVFKLRYDGYPNTLPNMVNNGEVAYRNIDTGCGVVPVKHVHLSDWVGGNNSYNADGRFYHILSERLPRTFMIPHVIYIYSPPRGHRTAKSGVRSTPAQISKADGALKAISRTISV